MIEKLTFNLNHTISITCVTNCMGPQSDEDNEFRNGSKQSNCQNAHSLVRNCGWEGIKFRNAEENVLM